MTRWGGRHEDRPCRFGAGSPARKNGLGLAQGVIVCVLAALVLYGLLALVVWAL